ncbi:MAG: MFS transporter [Sulfurifustis sp.]
MTVAPDVLRRFHRARLLVYGILAVSYMFVFVHRVAPAVIAADLMREFQTTGAALGTLAAMYFYVYATMQIPAGVLADTLGVRLAASVGALIAGAGSIVFGLSGDITAAGFGRFLVGLGVSVVFVGLMRANTEWWSERRYGFISGLTVCLGNVGALLAAVPLATLLAVTSWRTIFVVIGALSGVVAIGTFLFVRDRPEDLGFPSLAAMEGRSAHAAASRHWLHDLWQALRTRELWPGFFANFGLCGTSLGLTTLWGVPLLTDVHRLTRTEASLYTSVGIVTTAISSLLVGTLSDRIGRRKPVLVVACFAGAAVWLALLLAPWGPGWSGFLLFALLGLCTSGFVVTYGAAKEVVPPRIAGMAIAVVNTGVFLGAAVVQPLFGALMDFSWDGVVVNGVRRYAATDYANGLLLCEGLALMSGIAALYLRETYCRNVTTREPASTRAVPEA